MDYYNSMDYGMDDYDDPTEHMTPAQIRALERYVAMTQGAGYDDEEEDEDYPSFNPPPDPLYPGELGDYSDEE